jgi:hypothetical protein
MQQSPSFIAPSNNSMMEVMNKQQFFGNKDNLVDETE